MIKAFPQIGLGTWQVRGRDTIEKVIKAAYEVGYRHIDTATGYLNEKHIGKALKKLNIPRKEIFITSKVINFDYKGNGAYKSAKRSLKLLQIDYIDLYLLHTPFSPMKDLINAYKGLLKAKSEGFVKRVGVSNFNIEQLQELKKATGKYPFCNQIIAAPTVRREELEAFCKKNKIVLTGYSTLRSYYNPNPIYPGSGMNEEQKTYVDSLATKYKKNVGQVLSRWAIQNRYHIIPKSTRPKRVVSNFQINDFKLSEQEMTKLNSFNTLEDDKIMERFSKTMSGFALKLFKPLWKLKIFGN